VLSSGDDGSTIVVVMVVAMVMVPIAGWCTRRQILTDAAFVLVQVPEQVAEIKRPLTKTEKRAAQRVRGWIMIIIMIIMMMITIEMI
jgi:hypothetical protein